MVYSMPDKNSPRGNIFNILSEVRTLLNQAGLKDEANEMIDRITKRGEAKSYDEAKRIVMEYVKLL